MERSLNLLLHGPVSPLVVGTLGVTVYWILRFHARGTARYRLLAAELGEPDRVERWCMSGGVLALYLLLAYRGLTLLIAAGSP